MQAAAEKEKAKLVQPPEAQRSVGVLGRQQALDLLFKRATMRVRKSAALMVATNPFSKVRTLACVTSTQRNHPQETTATKTKSVLLSPQPKLGKSLAAAIISKVLLASGFRDCGFISTIDHHILHATSRCITTQLFRNTMLSSIPIPSARSRASLSWFHSMIERRIIYLQQKSLSSHHLHIISSTTITHSERIGAFNPFQKN